MPRPQISDERHEEVINIYRGVYGETPEQFEDAIELLLELVDTEVAPDGIESEGWYPGKYVGQAMDYLAERRLAKARGGMERGNERSDFSFKTILDKPDGITIPLAEVRANDLSEGDLLDVQVSRIED
jgi:hypothetical protein